MPSREFEILRALIAAFLLALLAVAAVIAVTLPI
jgi:hypothetical protein